MHISDRPLSALESELSRQQVDIYIQPMVDVFQSEYTPDSAKRLTFLTGFDGSAGLGIFFAKPTPEQSHLLLTDGRYTLQAAQQLGPRVKPLNSGETSLASILGGLKDLTIGFDPWLVTRTQLLKWLQAGYGRNLRWTPVSRNPVDAIWAKKSAEPAGEVVLHPIEFAGQSYEDKRTKLLEMMQKSGADGLVLTLPDGINWLLNIRGADVAYNPLLLSYFILDSRGNGSLFTYKHTFSKVVNGYLKECKIEPRDMGEIFSGKALEIFSGKNLLIDPEASAHGWWQLAEEKKIQLIEMEDPTLLPKACKNAAELDGMRAAHVRDGLALSRFLCWLDVQVMAKQLPTELEVVEKLESFRAVAPEYRGPSFATISGSGPNGAIVHYRADAQSNRRLQLGELFLLDSGGQYVDGTTDVTRTIAIGTPSEAMREHNTRVLKGHIALASARFPAGTSGQQLDVLARQYLWAAGLDYDHGTGHGVGAHLSVHEGPQRISKRGSAVPLQSGMIISNEPGYYAAGQYGIRIESLVTVVDITPSLRGGEADVAIQSKAGSSRAVGAQDNEKITIMGFETLTLAPIDTRLIALSLMTLEEREWLNTYHRRVYETHAPNMQGAERQWLTAVTASI